MTKKTKATKKKTKQHTRTARVEVLFTEPERKLLDEVCHRSSVSISHWVRHYALLQAKFALAGNEETDRGNSFDPEKVVAASKRFLKNYSTPKQLGT